MLKIKVSGEHVQVDEMHIPASVSYIGGFDWEG